MSQKEREVSTRNMQTLENSKTSLGLSLTPAFFAGGCCATLPFMVLFGISLGEEVLTWYQWYFRVGGVILFGISLWWYFYKQGVRSLADFKAQKTLIIIITLHATLYSVLIYMFFTQIITPILWHELTNEIANCCIIY